MLTVIPQMVSNVWQWKIYWFGLIKQEVVPEERSVLGFCVPNGRLEGLVLRSWTNIGAQKRARGDTGNRPRALRK